MIRSMPEKPALKSSARGGMTIIEVLVSVTVIGLLVALLIPAVQRAREAARLSACRSNLRQIGIGTHAYLDAFGQFPRGYGASAGCLFALLPFMDQRAVFALAEGIQDPAAKSASVPVIPVYLCPDDPTGRSSDVASYLANKGLLRAVGRFRGFVFEPVRPAEVTDGLSQTAFVSESIANNWRTAYSLPQSAVPLRRSRAEIRALCDECALSAGTILPQSLGGDSPSVLAPAAGYNHLLPPNFPACEFIPLPVDVKPPISGHSSGANVLYADGSVHFCIDSIDRNVWWNLGTIDSGDVATE
jgi:prepilin-type processing-associated H-X9-DG protein